MEGGTGDPSSPHFCPTGSDTTLQEFDQWFYEPATPIRSLLELVVVRRGCAASKPAHPVSPTRLRVCVYACPV